MLLGIVQAINPPTIFTTNACPSICKDANLCIQKGSKCVSWNPVSFFDFFSPQYYLALFPMVEHCKSKQMTPTNTISYSAWHCSNCFNWFRTFWNYAMIEVTFCSWVRLSGFDKNRLETLYCSLLQLLLHNVPCVKRFTHGNSADKASKTLHTGFVCCWTRGFHVGFHWKTTADEAGK